MDKKGWLAAAWCAAWIGLGWRDAQAGAWLGAASIAFGHLALWAAWRWPGPAPRVSAAEAEAIAWTESGSAGPRPPARGLGVPSIALPGRPRSPINAAAARVQKA